MLKTQLDTDQTRVPSSSLKKDGFFHFRELIAIPRMSDLVFRKAIFTRVWGSRKDALEDINKFVSEGKLFNASMLDMDLSTQRDYTLLFGTKDQLHQLHQDEARILPQNQSHRHHEKYALLTSLTKASATSVDYNEKIDELHAYLDKHTPKVTEGWHRVFLEDSESDWKSLTFLVPNQDAANKFESEVNEAVKRGKIVKDTVGLYALGFLDDLRIDLPESIEMERKLIQQILSNASSQPKKSKPVIDTNDTDFA